MPPVTKIKENQTCIPSGERIAKVIARAGMCSRRDAERWISEGRVKIDGNILSSPAATVNSTNKILVDGKPLPEPPTTRLWRYYKPQGLLTTHRDPQGRPNLFEQLPQNLPRLISIGRLDLNSEGLLLMTNDGGLARKLELPSTGWSRRYRARVHGQVDSKVLDKLKEGTIINGIHYGSIKAEIDRQQNSNAWITISLEEGNNREVRRVMQHLGWPVNRLIRIAFGPFQLGNLTKGTIIEVKQKIVREQLGFDLKGNIKSENRRR